MKKNNCLEIYGYFTYFIRLGLGLSAMYIFCSCATPHQNPNLNLIPESKYYDLIDSSTQKTEQYSGFHNVLTFHATLLDSQVGAAYLDQKARLYQWDESKYRSEQEAWRSNAQKNTEIIVSFFTPERKHDDLDKVDTQWKIFLDLQGQRFEGKAKKIKLTYDETMAFIPKHNRWSTAYIVQFPVPTPRIDSVLGGEDKNQKEGGIRLTITGPVASSQIHF